jgi:hypothetical protein
LADQVVAMDDQRTQLAHMGRGNPDLGQQVGGQQLGEDQGIPLVMFDFGAGNQADLLRMGP